MSIKSNKKAFLCIAVSVILVIGLLAFAYAAENQWQPQEKSFGQKILSLIKDFLGGRNKVTGYAISGSCVCSGSGSCATNFAPYPDPDSYCIGCASYFGSCDSCGGPIGCTSGGGGGGCPSPLCDGYAPGYCGTGASPTCEAGCCGGSGGPLVCTQAGRYTVALDCRYDDMASCQMDNQAKGCYWNTNNAPGAACGVGNSQMAQQACYYGAPNQAGCEKILICGNDIGCVRCSWSSDMNSCGYNPSDPATHCTNPDDVKTEFPKVFCFPNAAKCGGSGAVRGTNILTCQSGLSCDNSALQGTPVWGAGRTQNCWTSVNEADNPASNCAGYFYGYSRGVCYGYYWNADYSSGQESISPLAYGFGFGQTDASSGQYNVQCIDCDEDKDNFPAMRWWNPVSSSLEEWPNQPLPDNFVSTGDPVVCDYYLPSGSTGQDDCWSGQTGKSQDKNPSINPGMTEICSNGIDDNCNGDTDCNDEACVSDPSCKTDKIPPVSTLTITDPVPAPASGWYKSDVSYQIDAVDETGGSGVKELYVCQYQTNEPCNYQTIPYYSYSGKVTAEFTTYIRYYAVDNAGNVEKKDQQPPYNVNTIKIDKTAPTISNDKYNEDNSPVNTPHLTLEGSVTDSASGVKNFTINGKLVFVQSAFPFRYGYIIDLNEGPNTITEIAFDNAGNKDTKIKHILLDTVAPITQINLIDQESKPDGFPNAFTLSATDPGDFPSGVKYLHYSIDGGPEQYYNGVVNVAGGKHIVYYWSEDKAGNNETKKNITRVWDRCPDTPGKIDGCNRVLDLSSTFKVEYAGATINKDWYACYRPKIDVEWGKSCPYPLEPRELKDKLNETILVAHAKVYAYRFLENNDILSHYNNTAIYLGQVPGLNLKVYGEADLLNGKARINLDEIRPGENEYYVIVYVKIRESDGRVIEKYGSEIVGAAGDKVNVPPSDKPASKTLNIKKFVTLDKNKQTVITLKKY